MMSLPTVVTLSLLGAVGAVLRYISLELTPPHSRPWTLIVVNTVGSAVAGVALGAAASGALTTSSLLAVGAFAAGLTTLSTLAVSVAEWWEGGHTWRGVVVGVQHIALGALFVGAGYISASVTLSA
jgi:fluoride ion exporter CrcB/FEX